MKPVMVLVGAIVTFLGLLPFLMKIEAIATRFTVIAPEKITYHIAILVVGILVLLYGLQAGRRR